MQILKYILLIFIVFSTSIFCQYTSNVSNVATTAAPFLEIGIGSRAIGMGGAYVATANDASAMYWNPAGIGRLQALEVMSRSSKGVKNKHTQQAIDLN